MTDFDATVIAASQAHPVLAFFHADWCPHCRRLAPLLAAVAERHQLPLVAIDVDQEADLAMQHHAEAVPDVRLWHHGQEIASLTGKHAEPELERWLRAQMAVAT